MLVCIAPYTVEVTTARVLQAAELGRLLHAHIAQRPLKHHLGGGDHSTLRGRWGGWVVGGHRAALAAGGTV